MKPTILLILLSLTLLFSCNSNKKKTSEIALYEYSSETKLSPHLQEKIGDWIKEDIECYGVLITQDANGNIISGLPIKAKVLIITEKAIKMKTLEPVCFVQRQGCTQQGIDEGDTWWEKDGDLFRTKDEAIIFIEKLLENKEYKRRCLTVN